MRITIKLTTWLNYQETNTLSTLHYWQKNKNVISSASIGRHLEMVPAKRKAAYDEHFVVLDKSPPDSCLQKFFSACKKWVFTSLNVRIWWFPTCIICLSPSSPATWNTIKPPPLLWGEFLSIIFGNLSTSSHTIKIFLSLLYFIPPWTAELFHGSLVALELWCSFPCGLHSISCRTSPPTIASFDEYFTGQ